jgi:hypothetical protein
MLPPAPLGERDRGVVEQVVEKGRLLGRQEQEPNDVDYGEQQPAGADGLVLAVVREDVVDLERGTMIGDARGQSACLTDQGAVVARGD